MKIISSITMAIMTKKTRYKIEYAAIIIVLTFLLMTSGFAKYGKMEKRKGAVIALVFFLLVIAGSFLSNNFVVPYVGFLP